MRWEHFRYSKQSLKGLNLIVRKKPKKFRNCISARFGSKPYSMRNLFVIDPACSVLNDETGESTPHAQYRICPIRSMIDPRIRTKRISQKYPILTQDEPSFSRALRLYYHNCKLRVRVRRDFPNFIALNFYEYVLYCRVEFFENQKKMGLPQNSLCPSNLAQSLKRLILD